MTSYGSGALQDPSLRNAPPRRHRRWPIFAPSIVVLVLAIAWCGFWFYASSRADTAIAAWRASEAQAGRIYSCGKQNVGGFPFRFEVTCSDASAELRGTTPLSLHLTNVLVVAQIYSPTLLISEFTGPLTIGETGRTPTLVANWTLAQSSIRGMPSAPERASLVLDEPRFERATAAGAAVFATARHVELHGRLAEGSIANNPIVDVVLKLVAAAAPSIHPLAAQPIDADIAVTLRGLEDFAPKSWPDRLRELQARNGRLDITQARVSQGEIIAVGTGSLMLSPQGALDGELQVTMVGIDKLLQELRIDLSQPQQAGGLGGQLGAAFGALDRIAPGLGNLARQQAGPMIAAGIGALGAPATLEGKGAVTLPLRFADGAVMLGPIPLGKLPPMF